MAAGCAPLTVSSGLIEMIVPELQKGSLKASTMVKWPRQAFRLVSFGVAALRSNMERRPQSLFTATITRKESGLSFIVRRAMPVGMAILEGTKLPILILSTL
jgi:hypothetical protein